MDNSLDIQLNSDRVLQIYNSLLENNGKPITLDYLLTGAECKFMKYNFPESQGYSIETEVMGLDRISLEIGRVN